MDPKPKPLRRYESDSANALANLVSLDADMLKALKICDRLQPMCKADQADAIIAGALWDAALVAYARCFTSGKRTRLDPQSIAHVPGEPVAAHDFCKDMRDKLVAHSVN